jgi:hypothetical protein
VRLGYQFVTESYRERATVATFADVLTSDWGSLGGLRPSQRERSGSHLGGDPDIRPAPTLPVGPCGRIRPPPAPAGAIFMQARATAAASDRAAPAKARPSRPDRAALTKPDQAAPNQAAPATPSSTPSRQPGIRVGSRGLYVYGQVRQNVPCLPHNSIGGERFRLWWLNQGKRAEGCGCDLVNPVTAKQ